MGGMFDPVHNGHIETALQVRKFLSLDEMRLMPCARPPHRGSAVVSSEHRIAMLNLAVSAYKELIVDDRECRREGVSYAFDSLLSIKQENPEATLFFVLGTDAFNAFDSWYRWNEIFSLCHLVLIQRPGFELTLSEALSKEYERRKESDVAKLALVTEGKIFIPLSSDIALSSTKVRHKLDSSKALENEVQDSVAKYIQVNQLYR